MPNMKGEKKMARITLEVTVKNIYEFTAPAYGYGYETKRIYTMEDGDGKTYVWKTTAVLEVLIDELFYQINKEDIVKITATVKGESEYKGQPQTELTRVKVIERTFDAEETRKAKKAEKKAEQKASLKSGDFIRCMPYRQYKAHYADCETVVGSYNDHEGRYPATIEVIIREGRLKPSGVRGQHYSGYEFFYIDPEDGIRYRVCYRAVSEENALKRLYKNCPKAEDVTPGKIYMYGA